MSKLQFTAKCRIKVRDGYRDVPALPYVGMFAVTREVSTPVVTHVPSGMTIARAPNPTIGRYIASILRAMPFDFTDYNKIQHELVNSVWGKWLQTYNHDRKDAE